MSSHLLIDKSKHPKKVSKDRQGFTCYNGVRITWRDNLRDGEPSWLLPGETEIDPATLHARQVEWRRQRPSKSKPDVAQRAIARAREALKPYLD